MIQKTRRWWAAHIAGAALFARAGPVPAGQAGAAEEARAWIQRMNHAVVNQNYDGVLRQRFGERSEVYRIIHRMKDGEMVERVISTDRSGYQQKRKGARWAEFRPEQKRVIVQTRHRSFGYLPALNGLDRFSARWYDIRDLGRAQLLGRDVRVIHIDPRDDLRYGYRFWLDAESALPLKFQRTTLDGKVLKEIAFISPPALPASIADGELMVDVDARNFLWLSWDQFTPMHNPKLPRAYVVRGELLPAGYRSRIFNSPEEEANAKGPRARFIVSDGISWADVFIAPAGAEVGNFSVADGPLASYQLRLDDVRVVVVGEMPLATAKQIAEAVRPE
jgi:sigma-E factor negative regulatory protein RseB